MRSKTYFFNSFLAGSVVIVFFFFSCISKKEEKLTIAAAANLQFVIKELVQSYTAKSGVECEVILGSSGKLTAQIIEGAPFDVFLSADMKYPNELDNKGYSLSEPRIYAYGTLILWTLKPDLAADLSALTREEVKHIAIGNPKTAPYGVSAIEVLTGSDLLNDIKSKLVYGESVSQTNQFIVSEAAELGFTSKSVVLSGQMKNKGSWKEIDKSLYTPMAQGMVVLKSREALKTKALEFTQFVFSEEGRNILHKFGYQIKDL